jgi:methylthioribose-1-phosphate isomerase
LAGSAAGRVLICPGDAPVSNYGFDVTPSRLITGLLTERGLCPATASGIESLYPEKFCGSGGLV